VATYEHDYDAFSRLVLTADWMIAEMGRRAALGAAAAVAGAPEDTGDFAASITSEAEIRPARGRYKRRAVGRVVASDPAAFQIEHGTKDTPAHRTLGRYALPAMEQG
jgi:tetrahydromethanopterin S-methyltransferase subunit E